MQLRHKVSMISCQFVGAVELKADPMSPTHCLRSPALFALLAFASLFIPIDCVIWARYKYERHTGNKMADNSGHNNLGCYLKPHRAAVPHRQWSSESRVPLF